MIQSSRILFAAAAFLIPSVTAAQTQRMGRCHMGECGWTREVLRDFVGASTRGYLVRLEIVRGTSTNPRSGSAQKRPIKWEKKPESTFVFCSKSLPAVMFTLDGEFNTHLLDLYPKGAIPGYQEASLAIYMAVCHNVDVHAKYEDPSVYVERFKYEGERARYQAVEEAVKEAPDILRQ
ncbi:MAG: hypothetical protein Q8M31_03995 [Beijerinckiaceae bacterium]|nr:hypothetical protein [Beijerinckiaceae bacterium]